MGWQGSEDVIIDRFDVRAHLDHISEFKGSPEEKLSYDERLINYERYRILVQNDFLGGINSFRLLQKEPSHTEFHTQESSSAYSHFSVRN